MSNNIIAGLISVEDVVSKDMTRRQRRRATAVAARYGKDHYEGCRIGECQYSRARADRQANTLIAEGLDLLAWEQEAQEAYRAYLKAHAQAEQEAARKASAQVQAWMKGEQLSPLQRAEWKLLAMQQVLYVEPFQVDRVSQAASSVSPAVEA